MTRFRGIAGPIVSTTETGQGAEGLVSNHLKTIGYNVLARNWKTRWCEIDIVATKEDVTYFVEVKFRSSTGWGDGLDYITPTKLRQMSFAAEVYMAEHQVETCVIMAAAVDGDGTVNLQEIEL